MHARRGAPCPRPVVLTCVPPRDQALTPEVRRVPIHTRRPCGRRTAPRARPSAAAGRGGPPAPVPPPGAPRRQPRTDRLGLAPSPCLNGVPALGTTLLLPLRHPPLFPHPVPDCTGRHRSRGTRCRDAVTGDQSQGARPWLPPVPTPPRRAHRSCRAALYCDRMALACHRTDQGLCGTPSGLRSFFCRPWAQGDVERVPVGGVTVRRHCTASQRLQCSSARAPPFLVQLS
jgi:hypothetical protein